MAKENYNTTYKAPAPFTTKGYQNASIISVKGRRRGNGDRGFQLYCKMHKDGSDLYVLVRDTDDVIRLLTPWLIGSPFEDIYCMKVDEEFIFPADNQPVATVGWRMYGSQEQAFIPNIKSQEKPKVTEQTVAPATNDLDEALGRKKGEPPADDKPAPFPHELDPKKAIYAIPNHLKKHFGDEAGMHVRKIFGKSIDIWLKENNEDTMRAWDMVLTYEEQNIYGETETSSNKPQISTEPIPAAISTPNEQTSVEIERSSEAKPTAKIEVEELVPSPLLIELKTLTGIPVTKIQSYINRKHDQRYYKKIQARSKDDEYWTDLDPIAVRKRLDRVFGFQGLGWRIVPASGGGQVTCTPFTQKTKNGERQMYAVTMNAYVLEYALVDTTGKIVYVQTSAFSDGDANDDMGYAHRGAFTSLMKQALGALGGFDHFKDKVAS